MASATMERTGTSVQDVLARFEDGVKAALDGDGWRRYLDTQARFHRYSTANVFLILTQRPDATRVAGFHAWRDLGRFVRKGEKGIAILAPVTVRKRRDGDQDDGEPEAVTRFRVVHVFDLAQTDGDPLPEAPEPRLLDGDDTSAAALEARLRGLCAQVGFAVQTGDPGGEALGCYDPATNTVTLRDGLPAAQRAKTLCHEIGHGLMQHHGRVSAWEYVEQEAAAEGTAYVVCTWAGIDASGYSFDYAAGWASRSDGLAVVKRVGGAIQAIAAKIINAITGARQ